MFGLDQRLETMYTVPDGPAGWDAEPPAGDWDGDAGAAWDGAPRETWDSGPAYGSRVRLARDSPRRLQPEWPAS